jgi:hypothetical protein
MSSVITAVSIPMDAATVSVISLALAEQQKAILISSFSG